MTATPVRAAGCVLWRPAAVRGAIEIALVHRPKWDDWSHPKGKLKPLERAEEAALREVFEETGRTCELGTELPSAHYTDAQGRPKYVRYWAAKATGGTFAPNQEVDRLLWLSPEAASTHLTRPRDAELIPPLLTALRTAGTRPGG
ncbi:NUDIX hydrolase [Streptomyces iconiensis]|uniref:NUDIX hydrolase n=1 Tax=Streptomyces iconiensis TaxID=1384038 RepID=A0ABT7A3E4_9ACTN|nr:NUDIX hydrolase [Streptomyces iconiensis]MDJ1135859.1 NUDIX hydrolase [Streptomyces iconiensis]